MAYPRMLAGLGGLLAIASCSQSPPSQTFVGAPIPPIVALTCDLEAKHVGVLNPGYAGDQTGETLVLTFANLDPGAGTAQLIGNSGASTVEFRSFSGQLQFIEETPAGNVTVTSVFAPPAPGEPLPAVHSRHIAIAPGDVAISQFAGACKPKV